MKEISVELIRKFAPLFSRTGHTDFLFAVPGTPLRWHEIEDERRLLILAEPGAGKTFEALSRARKIHQGGKKAVFIRIEAFTVEPVSCLLPSPATHLARCPPDDQNRYQQQFRRSVRQRTFLKT